MKNNLVITGKRIVTPEGELEGYILVREGIIAELSRGAPPPNFSGERVEAGEGYVLPGFIDLHLHGFGGLEVGAAAGDLLQLARELARRGITAFLPTLVPLPLEQMAAVVEAVDRAMEEQSRAREEGRPAGAEILGIHLEGPFLNPAKKGVLRSEYFLLPSESAMEALRWGGSGKVRRITLAPELPGALELIRRLREKGFLVTGGHTAATMEETLAGIEAGISSATHLFNGMAPFHHRQPGPAGAYLSQRRVGCELIADGIHLHPLVLRLVLKCKGMEGAFAVSDATPAAGLPPGRYRFDERWISVDEAGACRLPDGTLAGGSFSMAEICAFLNRELGLTARETALLVSTNPARWAGLAKRKGVLAQGREADIVIADGQYRILGCWIKGIRQLPF